MENFTRDPNCLGYIVLYGASSKVDPVVDDVNDELRAHGLDNYQLTRPTAAVAVSRAAKKIQQLWAEKKIQKSSEHRFFRGVVNDSSRKSAAIIYEKVNSSNDTLEFEQETTGVYYKAKKSFKAKGRDKKKFERFFYHYSNHVTGDDIRQVARDVIEAAHYISLRGGTYVRDAGGVYFVPRDRIDELESLKHVLENLKIGYVKAFSVTDGKSERADLFDDAIIFFTKEIESIQQRANKVTCRKRSLEKCRTQLEEAKRRMSAYALLTGRRKNKQVDEFYSRVGECIIKIDRKIARLKSKKKKKSKKAKGA